MDFYHKSNCNNDDIDIDSNILDISAELINHESPTRASPMSPKSFTKDIIQHLEIVTPKLGRADTSHP